MISDVPWRPGLHPAGEKISAPLQVALALEGCIDALSRRSEYCVEVRVARSMEGSVRPLDGVPLPAVSGEAACDATTGGWYVVDPSHPSAIEICPKSCDEIDRQLGRVEIFFSCGPGPPPP
jgi:hypothetical protein